MFEFESEEIEAQFKDLLLSTTGDEPCYDPNLATPEGISLVHNSHTDQWVEDFNTHITKQEAEALCEGCPVLEKCGAYALAAKERFGIWGGTRPVDRGFTYNTYLKRRYTVQ